MHFKASLYLQLIKSDVKNWRLSNHLRVACNKYDDVLLTICKQFVFVFHKLSKNCSNHPIAAMLFLYSNSGFTWLVEFTELQDLNSIVAIKHTQKYIWYTCNYFLLFSFNQCPRILLLHFISFPFHWPSTCISNTFTAYHRRYRFRHFDKKNPEYIGKKVDTILNV